MLRDTLASVSLDARQSPGPGSYIEQTQISPKQIAFLQQPRYNKNPFGITATQPRFDYQREYTADKIREERAVIHDLSVID